MKIELAKYISPGLVCLLGFIFCCWGCSKSIDEQSELLNLVAPSGERISESVLTLKEETSSILKNNLGVHEDFEITNLRYLPVVKGYVVFVEYQTQSGVIGSFAKATNTRVRYSSSELMMNIPRLKSQSENPSGGGNNVVFSCIPNGSCSSCKLEGEMYPDEGIATVRCSCPECKLKTHIY